jgi:Cu/Ag efflux pump CusA
LLAGRLDGTLAAAAIVAKAQRTLAFIVILGLISATVLTLFALPAIKHRFRGEAADPATPPVKV